MRCVNCNYRVNKTWKVCPNCGNKLNDKLPFKSKRKEWIDKHLLLVNIIYCFPVNLIYTALPALLVYWFFTYKFNDANGFNVINTSGYLIGITGIFPFLLIMFFFLFIKVYMKSFMMAKYAYDISKDKKYYIFTGLDIIGIVALIIIYFSI